MAANTPRHIAIIMDGNGRWAKQRHLPRSAGHRAGIESVRRTIQACSDLNVEVLTLFAFSTENWRRSDFEVGYLMRLLLRMLRKEVVALHQNNVRLKVIGNRERLSDPIRSSIDYAEGLTAENTGLTLQLAIDYGGRWELVNAAQAIAKKVATGELKAADVDETVFRAELEFPELPEPDLFIRTSGELRISNFLLWHLAYTECYFTDTLWPDFDVNDLQLALADYAQRQRRYGGAESMEQTEGA